MKRLIIVLLFWPSAWFITSNVVVWMTSLVLGVYAALVMCIAVALYVPLIYLPMSRVWHQEKAKREASRT